MNLECSKNKERNPFTKKCILKCRKGTRRVRNGKKKKFVCFKPCTKGSSRSKLSNRCKRRSKGNRSVSASRYYTPFSRSPSLKYYHNNSPDFSNHNEMRSFSSKKKTPSSSRSSSMTFHTPLTSEKPGSPSLAYFHSNTSPDYSGHNEMRGSPSQPSSQSLEYLYDRSPDFANENEMRGSPSQPSSQSLEYLYDRSPDFANENEMRGSPSQPSSQSLEYLYDRSPDFANHNEMRSRSKSKSKSKSKSRSKSKSKS